jgi:hypothetical protein
MKMKQVSFSPPRNLRDTTIDTASRSALSDFGTTPEMLRETLNVTRRGMLSNTYIPKQGAQEANTTKPKAKTSKDEQPKQDIVSSFPSMFAIEKGVNPLSIRAETKASVLKDNAFEADSGPSAAKPLAVSTEQPSSFGKASPSLKPNSSTFGMGELGSSLFSSKPSEVSLFADSRQTTDTERDSSKDYHALLTKFYQQFNPTKVGEVGKHLEKYKGREAAMFEKLAHKYNTTNPLEQKTPQSPGNASGSMPSSGFGTSAPSPFPPSPKSTAFPGLQKPPSLSSPFGTPLKAGISQSPFDAPSTSMSTPAFGVSGTQSTSSFGQIAPLNALGQPGSNVFGQAPSAGPLPSPFGSSAPPSAVTFRGKTPRELLTEFYMEKNPAKVAEVDKLLSKYQGDEERMFRNLAKKYNLDPAVFGLSTSAPPSTFGTGSTGGFGQPSPLGGGPTFGLAQPNTPFVGPPTSGGFGSAHGPGFGSASGASNFGSVGFGALAAQSPPAPGFASFSSTPTPFGSPTPFGAPRR